ncbi:methyltransferase domain-containing protein, partial [Nocardia cyriacigeorgica]|uniref:methyltransferase domain-containing protein n=1 Tax=Nocardia cyriacigeorgica TaxID=135487 RepID=UPI002455593D
MVDDNPGLDQPLARAPHPRKQQPGLTFGFAADATPGAHAHGKGHPATAGPAARTPTPATPRSPAEPTPPDRGADDPAVAAMRQLLGPLASRFAFSPGARSFDFLDYDMLRADLDAFTEEFARLRPTFDNVGGGDWHAQTLDFLRAKSEQAPVVRYVNRYDAGGTADLTQLLEGISGEVDSVGSLVLRVRSSDRTPSGSEMFDDLWQAIGQDVSSIHGAWKNDSGQDSNLVSFNAGVAAGLSPQDAALATWTGKMATRHGFSVAEVLHLEGPPGNHTTVAVSFTKPQSSALGDSTSPRPHPTGETSAPPMSAPGRTDSGPRKPADPTRREEVGDLRIEAVDCLVRASNALGHLDLSRGNIPAAADPRWAALANTVTNQPGTTWNRVVADLLASATADSALVYVEGTARHHALVLTRFDQPAGPEVVVFDGRLAGAHELSTWEALDLEGGAHRSAPTRARLFSMNDDNQLGPDLSGIDPSIAPKSGKPVEGALSHLPGDEPSKSFLEWLRSRRAQKRGESVNPNLRNQFLVETPAVIADNAWSTGSGLFVLGMGGSMETVALMTAGASGATLVTQLAAGPITDRGNNRLTLQLASATQTAAMLSAGGWILLGLDGAQEAVVGATIVTAATTALRSNTSSTYRKKLVRDDTKALEEEDLKVAGRYNVLQNAMASAVGKSLGPIVGPIALGASGALHLVNQWVLYKLPSIPTDKVNRPGLLEGPRRMFNDRFMRNFLILTPPATFGSTMGIVILTDLVAGGDYSALTSGLLMSGIATGMVATKGLESFVPKVKQAIGRAHLKYTYPVSMASSVGLLLAYANTSDPYILLGAMGSVGATNYVNNLAFQRHTDHVVPKSVLGGAGSTLNMFGAAGGMAAGLAAAATLPTWGAQATATAVAGLFGLTTIGATAVGFSIRKQTYDSAASGDESAEHAELGTSGSATIRYGALQLARVAHALGLDDSPEPDETDPRWDAEDNWRPLADVLGADLRPISAEGDPIARVVKAVHTPGNGIDRAYMALRQGTNVFGVAIINVDGTTLIFGPAADGSDREIDIPRIRAISKDESAQTIWQAPGKVDEAFAVLYTIDRAGKPVPRDLGLRARANTRHPAKMPNHSADDRRAEQLERYLEGLDERLVELDEGAHLPEPLAESDGGWQARFDAEIAVAEAEAAERLAAQALAAQALAESASIPVQRPAASRPYIIFPPVGAARQFDIFVGNGRRRVRAAVGARGEVGAGGRTRRADGSAPYRPPQRSLRPAYGSGSDLDPGAGAWEEFSAHGPRDFQSPPTIAKLPGSESPSVWFAAEPGRPGALDGGGPREPHTDGPTGDAAANLVSKVDEARDHGRARRAEANSEAEELAVRLGLEPRAFADPEVLDSLRRSREQLAQDIAHRLHIDPSAVGPWVRGLVPYSDLDGAPEGGALSDTARRFADLDALLTAVADQLLAPRPAPRPLLPEDWRSAHPHLEMLADGAWTKLTTIRAEAWQTTDFLGKVVQGAKSFDALNREQKWSLLGDLNQDRYGIPARWRNRIARLALLRDKQADDADRSRQPADADDEFDATRTNLATALIGLAAAEHQAAELTGHPQVHLYDRHTESFSGPAHIAMAIGDADDADDVRIRVFGNGISPASILEAVQHATADLVDAEKIPGRRVASVILLTDPASAVEAADLVGQYILGLVGTREHYSTQPGGRPPLGTVHLQAGDEAADAIVRHAEQDPELVGLLSEPAGVSTDPTPHADGSAGFRVHDSYGAPRDDVALAQLLEGEYAKDCATQVVGELSRAGLPIGLPGRRGEHGEMFAPEFSGETGARFEPSGFVGDSTRTARDKVADRLAELGAGARVALVVRRPGDVGAHMTLWTIDQDDVVWEREVHGYDPTEQPLAYRPREVRWTRYERGTRDEPGAEYFGTAYRAEEHSHVGTVLRPALPFDPNDPGDPSADFPMNPIGARPGNDQPVDPVVADLLGVLDEQRIRSARNAISREFANDAVDPSAAAQLVEARYLLDELLDHIKRPETADPQRFQLLTHLFHAVEARHATPTPDRQPINDRIDHLRETLRRRAARSNPGPSSIDMGDDHWLLRATVVAVPEAPAGQAPPRTDAERLVRSVREQAGLPPENDHGHEDLRANHSREMRQIADMDRRYMAHGPFGANSAEAGTQSAQMQLRTEPTTNLLALLADIRHSDVEARLVVGGGHTYRPAEPGEVFVNIAAEVRPDLLADVRNLSAIPDDTFDVVYLERAPLGVLLESPHSLAEAHRVLKPGGQLLLSPGIAPMVHADARRAAIQRLEEAGFDEIDFRIGKTHLIDEERPDDWYEITATKPVNLRPDRPALSLGSSSDRDAPEPTVGPQRPSHVIPQLSDAAAQRFNDLRPASDALENKMEEQFGHKARIARYITPNGSQIWYSAQHHTKQPTDEQFPYIRRAAEVFLTESSGRERIILHEGGEISDDSVRGIGFDEAVRNGDWWHTRFVAQHHGIQSKSADTPS